MVTSVTSLTISGINAFSIVYSPFTRSIPTLPSFSFCTLMAKDSCENAHQQQCARSYANLDKAQADAKWKNGYDWHQT